MTCLQSLMVDNPHFVYSTYNKMILRLGSNYSRPFEIVQGDTSPQDEI